MTWTVRHDPATGVVKVAYTGRVTSADLVEAATARIRLQKEVGAKRVLIDISGVTEPDAGIPDVFELPGKLYAEMEACPQSRMAVVLPEDRRIRDIACFFETASRNRGWMVRSFEKRRDALDWLDGED